MASGRCAEAFDSGLIVLLAGGRREVSQEWPSAQQAAGRRPEASWTAGRGRAVRRRPQTCPDRGGRTFEAGGKIHNWTGRGVPCGNTRQALTNRHLSVNLHTALASGCKFRDMQWETRHLLPLFHLTPSQSLISWSNPVTWPISSSLSHYILCPDKTTIRTDVAEHRSPNWHHQIDTGVLASIIYRRIRHRHLQAPASARGAWAYAGSTIGGRYHAAVHLAPGISRSNLRMPWLEELADGAVGWRAQASIKHSAKAYRPGASWGCGNRVIASIPK